MEQRSAVATHPSAAERGLSTLASAKVYTDRADLLNSGRSESFIRHALNVIRQHGFTKRKRLDDVFADGGYSGVVILEESHLTWHSWPELGFVTVDLHVCDYSRNNEAVCEGALCGIVRFFQPTRVVGIVVRFRADDSIRTRDLAFH